MSLTNQRVIGAILLLAATALVAWQAWRFLAVDACLDLGGSYDYVLGTCDLINTHRYQSWVEVVLLGTASLLASVGTWLLVRDRSHWV